MTITASGATTYSFVLSNTVITTNPLTTVAVPTATGVYQLGVFGSSNGCIAGGTATFAVNSNPTVAVSSSTNNACTNSTVNITASGAAGYSWTGAATSTNNPLTFTTGATAGTSIFTVVGTNSAGCTHTATFSQAVVVCNTSTGTTVGLMNVSGYEETAIFPNPFANEIKINVLDGHVVIYNAIGQAVITTPVRSSEIINTTELPKGAYLVKAFNSNGEVVKTVKLIKN